MKKWISIILVLISGVLLVFSIHILKIEDRTGPVIHFSENKSQFYTETISNEALLEGVTAEDERDGDVSDSLRVESIYFSEDGYVNIIFVAKDKNNNITKEVFQCKNGRS